MIVKMKKLSTLLYHREKEDFLNTLRDAGVVHIKENSDVSSEEMTLFIEKQKKIKTVLSALKKGSASLGQKKDGNAEDIIERYLSVKSKIDICEQEIQNDKKLVSDIEPWGEFNPADIKRLIDSGLSVKLLFMSSKKFDELDKKDMAYEVISKVGSTTYFMLVEREDEVEIDVEETPLPELSLMSLKERLEELEKEQAELKDTLGSLSAYYQVVYNYSQNILEKTEFESARLSMEEGAEGAVLSLSGWFPIEDEKKVTECLDKFSCWYEIAEPAEDENTPVKLKNKNSIDLFEPIVNIYSLPDYLELDPTPFLAPFFAFFFGLCLGDLGYGILLLLISFIGMAKAPKNLKPFMKLGVILGGFTAVGGLLLNTFFGHDIFAISMNSTGYLQGGKSIALLAQVTTEKGTYFPAMPFSMYIGVFQILFATVLKMVNKVRNEGPIFTLQPFSSLLMITGVTILMAKIDFVDLGKFEFGIAKIGPFLSGLPNIVHLSLIYGGLGVLFLFNNPDKKIPVRLGLGFWELYNFASGLMGDSLSYLRLFALGLAGGLLGAAFNQIAFMFITSSDGTVNYASVGIVATIIVLIVGHVLNFALAALGSFVHPLRLTFVEFYSNLDFKGGAKAFKPFSKIVNN